MVKVPPKVSLKASGSPPAHIPEAPGEHLKLPMTGPTPTDSGWASLGCGPGLRISDVLQVTLGPVTQTMSSGSGVYWDHLAHPETPLGGAGQVLGLCPQVIQGMTKV